MMSQRPLVRPPCRTNEDAASGGRAGPVKLKRQCCTEAKNKQKKCKLHCPAAASEIKKKRKEAINIKKKKVFYEKCGYICGTLYVQDLFCFVVFFHHVRAIIKMKMGLKLM